jgi:hypothetical protein
VSAKINLNIDKLFEEIANKLPKNVAKKDVVILTDNNQVDQPGGMCQKC